MTINIATNWQTELIDRLADLPIRGLYGSLPKTPTGGGRPAMILPDVSTASAEKHIKKILDAGLEFDYLLNALCMGNKQSNKAFRTQLKEQLQWIVDLGIPYITVANPYVLEFSKYHFPSLKVKISILLDVNTTAKAKQFESLGADEIAVSIMMNRDFVFLKSLKEAVNCGLTLLVNQTCLYQCPYRLYHGTVNAHSSQCDGADDNFALNYCMLQCSIEKLSKPEQLIKSRWIRPEDLSTYEKLGYQCFKIAGREMSTEWLINAATAYAQRSYNGNLADLLNGLAVMMGMAGPGAGIMPYIDNKSLNGFLTFFQNKDCKNCQDCPYCAKIAANAIQGNVKENETFIRTLTEITETIV